MERLFPGTCEMNLIRNLWMRSSGLCSFRLNEGTRGLWCLHVEVQVYQLVFNTLTCPCQCKSNLGIPLLRVIAMDMYATGVFSPLLCFWSGTAPKPHHEASADRVVSRDGLKSARTGLFFRPSLTREYTVF